MRIKYSIALIAFVASVASVFSQSDIRAREILKESGQMYKRYKTLSADFALTTKSGSRKGFTNKGKLYIKSNKKVNMFHLDYADQTIQCDGKHIWTYNPLDEEVTLELYKKKTNDMSPEDIFNIYNKGFKASYNGFKNAHHHITLVPKRPKKYKFSYIKVEFAKNKKLQRVVQHYKNGTDIIINITDQVPNKSLAKNLFVWDAAKNKNVTLVDLR